MRTMMVGAERRESFEEEKGRGRLSRVAKQLDGRITRCGHYE